MSPKLQRVVGSYVEKLETEIGNISFSFEPDPEYDRPQGEEPGPDCYMFDYRDGYMPFQTLDEMESFAHELLAFVKRHRM